MKVILFSRADVHIAPGEIEAFFALMDENGLDYTVNRDFAAAIMAQSGLRIPAAKQYEHIGSSADNGRAVVISYGGDGTFLDAARLLAGSTIPIAGVNFGHLGFLANIPKNDLRAAFAEIKAGKFEVEPRSMIYVEGDFERQPDYPYAFNEFSIQRKGINLITLDVCVNGDWVAAYRADGVIISTPSGSTAYSLSVGGPIVAPDCSCFVISPIAPHNLTMRPIVIPDTASIEIRLNAREPKSYASLDNRSFDIANHSKFTVSKAKKSVFIARLQNISFYDTLRNKMMWGLDGMSEKK